MIIGLYRKLFCNTLSDKELLFICEAISIDALEYDCANEAISAINEILHSHNVNMKCYSEHYDSRQDVKKYLNVDFSRIGEIYKKRESLAE